MQLLRGDCLEIMKTLPDKSVDLFVCDLPYGCLTGGAGKEKAKRKAKNIGQTAADKGLYGGSAGGIFGCAWDIPIDLAQFWVQVKRLAKDDHTPVLMFCTTKFGYELIKSNEAWFRYDLIWNKSRGVGFLCANKMPLRSHEMIYVFSKKGATYYRKDIEGDFKKCYGGRGKQESGSVYGVIPMPGSIPDNTGKRCVKSVIDVGSISNKNGQHPTQKPDDLYEWLIERYSKPGDTVLDPTAGSFASVFTAEKMGRVGIGIEMDEGFYQKALARSQA
jgi:site-specific DNA-methyltransferase (adenine-specific)